MVTRTLVKSRAYFDSVRLMNLSTTARTLPGITQAVALMATERNKAALEASGLSIGDAATARPDDLLVVIEGQNDEAVQQALARVEEMLAEGNRRSGGASRAGEERRFPRSLGAALRLDPHANLALISVPGVYAAAEAAKALRRGLNVLIFSDNVSVEDEVRLKRMGEERGLLVMGPDCGTAIIGGVPLAFANAIARGPIGIVGASGTGIQEVSVLVTRAGFGITHAIGTGGRDTTDAVGGITMLAGLEALDRDPDTRVIVLVSKTPGPETAKRILERVRACARPVVVAFLGADRAEIESAGAVYAEFLEEAAAKAVALAQGRSPASASFVFPRGDVSEGLPPETAPHLKEGGRRFLRGVYTGGTLAGEAVLILERSLGGVYSNVPPRPSLKLPDARRSLRHSVVDLGDDEFTRGRPHPMIDPSYREERLLREAADPEVAVILCDVVLGYGCHPDPAGALAQAVRKARNVSGREFAVVTSVCGTEDDPQNLAAQQETLRREGVLVFPSNAYAAEVAGRIARAFGGRDAD